MAKLKLIRRDASGKPQKSTPAKVEKVKSGRPTSQPGRFLGKTTGMSVAKFQNKTLEDNRKKRLTDAQLAKLWKSEFPNAISDYTEAIVRGVRSAYNRGKHGNNDGQPLAKPVPQFDEQGNAIERFRSRDTGDEPSARKSSGKVVKKVKKGAK